MDLDNIFIEFKNLITIDKLVELLHNVYVAWQEANESNLIDEEYSSFKDWFEDYYDSIIDDTISVANDDFNFNDKYLNLSVDDIKELKSLIKKYIYDSKNEIENKMDERA